MEKIPDRQARILKHALGVEQGGQPYRNNYHVTVESYSYVDCKELESAGYTVERVNPLNEMTMSSVFMVTQKGFDYLKELADYYESVQ